ncbi:hypothetical protein EC917_101308 [Bacillus thuringiensis]|uniref:Uncharacterized protein n=1 Tax=Bacillus thuringiensis TaxID=1428 RepID=A0A4R4BMM5_BACTU|nr:hypothetical protein [Bacillus thuringiensis]TCW59054.1 hypothetical protein EC917_101308 [Bacillus thuringiensis]TCW59706.1 hypothetical protein EC910_101336 [Bacillus thuringiensis]
MKQLTLEDVVGSFDYKAKSTAERFLAKTPVITTYAVDFYKDKRQSIDWFEANNRNEAEAAAKGKHGYKIQIVKIYVSDRTLKEIMELD